MIEPGTVIDGRYELVELLGSGGFATVWRAGDRRLDKQVAVKVLQTGEARSRVGRERFRREAKFAARLNHQHIARVTDYGHDEQAGVWFLVSELIVGQTLKDRGANRRMSGPEVSSMGAEIASALQAVHAAGHAHRDVHYGNVMLSDDRGAVLLDFGIARDVYDNHELTSSSAFGYVPFMAPERMSLIDEERPGDIFSLGVCLWWALTGSLPHGRGRPDFNAWVAQISAGPIWNHAADEQPQLAAVLRRMLDADPQRRPSASELLKLLDANEPAAPGRRAGQERQELAVGLASVADAGHHMEVWRVTPSGRVEHRWNPDDDGGVGWSPWYDFDFSGAALDLAAVSGHLGHVEVFILERSGNVSHRWWLRDSGWSEFADLGRPFGSDTVKGISAGSYQAGHIEVFVEALDGRIANIWYQDEKWNYCNFDWALGDRWWSFSDVSTAQRAS